LSKKNKEMEVETNEFGLVSVSLRQKIRGCEIRSKKWLIYRSPLKNGIAHIRNHVSFL